MPAKIDIDLWRQVTAACPKQAIPPAHLPMPLRPVDGCRVILVDGDEVKCRPDKSEDGDHPHMDFVEGANDLEARWVRREFGKKVLLLDDNIAPHDLPFVLMHEAVERRHMAQGDSYGRAHPKANAVEKMLRLAVKRANAQGGQHAPASQRTA